MSSQTKWTWSPAHGDYYCYLYNRETHLYDILKWGRHEFTPNSSTPQPALASQSSRLTQAPATYSADSVNSGYSSSLYSNRAPHDQYTPYYTAPQSSHTLNSAQSSQSYPSTQSATSGLEFTRPGGIGEYQIQGISTSTSGFQTSAYQSPYQASSERLGDKDEGLDEERAHFKLPSAPPDAPGAEYGRGGKGGKGISGRATVSDYSQDPSEHDLGFEVMRSPSRFFREGRVFAILDVSEQAGVFVVVQAHDGEVIACPILSYDGLGTTKRGVDPTTHTVAYPSGATPQYLPGESATLEREPIEISWESNDIVFEEAFRINFGKTYSIHSDTKVKSIGRVAPDSMELLTKHWRRKHRKEHQTPLRGR